jgi:hypothetical protein
MELEAKMLGMPLFSSAAPPNMFALGGGDNPPHSGRRSTGQPLGMAVSGGGGCSDLPPAWTPPAAPGAIAMNVYRGREGEDSFAFVPV